MKAKLQMLFLSRRSPFEASLWKAASYAISTGLSFLTIRDMASVARKKGTEPSPIMMPLLTSLLYLAPLLILQGGSSLSAFTAEQLQTLALLFLKLNQYAYNIDLVFFGLWCVLPRYLIFGSTFLPRVLGVLLAISGLGWVTYLYRKRERRL